MIKRLLILTVALIFSPLQANTPDITKVISALEYAREENLLAAAKASEIFDQTAVALEELNLFKMIDVVLQTCLYTTQRIKHFEDATQHSESALEIESTLEITE